MTNDEAIVFGKRIANFGWLNNDTQEFIELAVKALEQDPCEDTISRQAVIDQTYLWSKDEFLRVTNPFDYLRKRINSLPPVTPQTKTGHWIRWFEQKENDWGIEYKPHCKCSECGKDYDPLLSQFVKYCNECGAKMVELHEGEDKE